MAVYVTCGFCRKTFAECDPRCVCVTLSACEECLVNHGARLMKIDPENQIPAKLLTMSGEMVAMVALPPFQKLSRIVVWGQRFFILEGSDNSQEYGYTKDDDGGINIESIPEYREAMAWFALPDTVEVIPSVSG